jgi:hypothetical protein
MVRGGAVIMGVVSGKAPATDFPQGAVVLVVVGRVLIAFEAVREGGGGPGPLAFLTWEEVEASLWHCPTLETVMSIFIGPL